MKSDHKGDFNSDDANNIKDNILKIVSGYDKQRKFVVNEQLSKQARCYWLIYHDIEIIEECLNEIISIDEDSNQDLIVSALWQMAIMTYGKIFTNSEDGFIKLEYKIYIKDESFLNLHGHLIKLRNSFIAHRGENSFEKTLLIASLEQTNERSYFDYSFPTALKTGNYLDKDEMKVFMLLLNSLKEQLGTIIKIKVQKLDNFLRKKMKELSK